MKKTRLNLLLSGLLLAIPAAFGGVDDEYLALRRSVGDGHFEEALRRSMSLIRQYPGYLYFYETLAEVAHYAQKDSLALQEFEERIEDGTELGLAYYGLGVTCCNLKNYQSAVLCFTKAIDAGNVTAECHRRFEMAYEKMEGIDAAISYFNLLCRRDPSNPNSWYRLALAYWSKQDVKKVASCLDEALAKRPHERRFLQAKAALLCLTGRQRRARPLIDSLLSRCDRELDFEGKALLESYVIMEYAEARRVEVITHSIENVIQIGRDYGFLRWLGWGYKMMADAVAQMGDYRSALRNINKAIEIAQAPYDTELLVASLTSGIDICDETGDYSQALKMALQANLVCTQEGMTRSRLITLCDIAWILHELGADDIALEYSVEALNDAELHNAEPGLIYAVHSVLGFAHEGLGKLDDALKDFGEASRAIPSDAFRDKANSLNNTWIGEILFRQGRYHQAEVFLGGQLCVARSRGYLSTENIAEAYLGLVKFERGRYQEALYHLKGAFDRATRMGQHPIVVLCSRGLSVLYEKQGRISEALVWLQKAIAESEVMGLWQEQLSSISRFNRGLFEDYEASVPLLCKLGRIEEAFVASEKAKLISAIPILLLPEVYGSGCEVSPTGGPLDSLRREILRVRDEIGVAEGSKRLLRDLTTKIRLLSDLNRLEMTFHAVLDNVEKSTGVSSNVLDRYLLSIRELRMQSVLQPGGAILEFVVRSNTTIGLVVTRSSIQSVDLGLGRERLNELLRNASRMFQPSDVKNVFNVSSASFDTRALHVLYQTLIGPMHEALSGVSDLTIIPDDALCNFPFEILVTSFEPAMGEGKETQIRYLAENLAISYRPVAMLVRPGRSMRERNEGYLLAVGVGEGNAHQKAEGAEFYGLDRFPENSDVPRYFPGVEKEVKAIQTEFGDRCAILSGSSVSREKLVSLIGGYRCVHIAGHIEIDESHLLYSTICSSAVTEGAPSNPLRAFDLASASSHMQMFVLSGCNTARSMVEDGSEGLAGFLFCAGAHSSVGTKWPVDDESTALFMQHLYRHLREGEPKSRSLQLARLDMMRTGKSDPFYWGAFVLIGDTSPLDWQAPDNTKGSKTVWLAGPMSVIVAICVVVYFRRRTGKSTCQK